MSCGTRLRGNPKVGWDKIVAIIDAAAPVEPPVIPARAERAKDKAAPRKRRSDRSLPSVFNKDSPGAPEQPQQAVPEPDAAAAPAPPPRAADGGIVPFRASSQKGGSDRESVAAADGEGGAPPNEPPSGFDQPPDDGGDLNLRLAFYPHTDLGNAERFRERYRGRLLWCPAIGWLWWDGKRWCRDGADEKVKVAEHDTVRGIQREGDALRDSGRDFYVPQGKDQILMSDKLRRWGRQSEAAAKLNPIAKRAAPYLFIAPDALDADPFKLNVANGTLVFHKTADGSDYITFKRHDPADLITKCSRVVYDRHAEAPVFDAFLAYVQPKPDDRRFLLAWQGLSLTGDVTEQKLCVFWGKGKNGKSTFIDVCAFVAGDYSETVPIETFLNEGRSRNAGQATPDLAVLPGVRHLRTSEPNKGAKLDEALIKLATGGEPVLARHLNRDYFKFYPQFKLTISGNYRPSIAGSDEGIWRRVQLVPWAVTVAADKIDPRLGDKLSAEASGILNRLLDGLRDWLDHGLLMPDSVREATADYRRDSDPLGRFLEACVVPAPGQRVQSSVMHELFCAWAKANGAREWSNKGMSDALKERGFTSKQSNVMWWLNVSLIRSVNDFLDHEGKPLRTESPNSQERGGDDVVDF
jgi:putative DNA primase/helicase